MRKAKAWKQMNGKCRAAVGCFRPALNTVVVLIALFLTACSGGISGRTMPTLPPTPTAVPHTTPTAVPAPEVEPPAAVDWSDVGMFRQAMRPAFAGDVDAFANRNRYVIEATVELTDVAAIYGAERVRYTNRSADTLSEIVFRLYPNLDAYSGQMNITEVTVNGEPVIVRFEDRRSVMVVPLAEPLAPQESVELTVGFNSAIEKGFAANYGEYSYQQGIFAAPQWYPALSVYEEGRGWWTGRSPLQGDPSYMETGLYDVRVTAAEDMTIVLSGSEIGATTNGDGTVTHHVVSGPMRDSILIASRELGRVSGETDGITVNIYYWNDERAVHNERAARAGLQMTIDSLDVFNRVFGQYPFAEFDVVQTDTDAGGIEYPGLIVVADNYWDTGDSFFEVVIAHETAHQWWYSLVGNNQVEQPFVDESLTSFCEYVYFWETAQTPREVEDAEDYVRGDQAWYNTYVGQGNPNLPLGLPVASYAERAYVMIIYTKGPLFFNEIAETIGREQLYAVLQEYFRRYRYEVATIGDMLAVFEDVTGQSWDAFFYEWVGSFPGLDTGVIPTVNAMQQGG